MGQDKGVTYEVVVVVSSDDDSGTATKTATFATAAEARAWVLEHATITRVVRKVVA